MEKTYEYNPAVQTSLREFSTWRHKQLYSIIFQTVFCLACLSFILYEDLIGIENVVINIGNQNEGTYYAYIILLIWLFCIIVKFVLHYMEEIPFLNGIQDRMERKQFEKLKKTYEYQLKLNDYN